MVLSGFCIILLFPLVILPLRITRLEVPVFADVRGIVQLSCHFDLENSVLQSIKWYKDDEEFFRFVPSSAQPEVNAFKVSGVRINRHRSNVTLVTLIHLSYNTSGVYKCEVSAEAPLFKIASKSANLTIVGLPQYPPRISGIQPVYKSGDRVFANCSASPSKPPAILTWLINDKPAPDMYLVQYKSTPSPDDWQLESRTLSISFPLSESHLESKVLNFTCTASVAGFIVNRSSTLAMPAELKSSRKNDLNNQATDKCNGCYFLWTLLVLILTEQLNRKI